MDFSKPSEPYFLLISVNQPIRAAVNFSLAALQKVGVSMDLSLASDLPLIDADPHLMEQVILNLITNAKEAMKNMPEGKVIRITSSGQPDRIVVTISDTGPGVPLHLGNRVFDPFCTTKKGNTGIGLSLCKRIVVDHGGSLSVNNNERGGAEFKIELPLKPGQQSERNR
jgi:C4-dicarboxylate-specific signal transduction histidine kinase